MEITLKPWEGNEPYSLLERIDFTDISGPLSVDMGLVPFVKPPTLGLLYALFKRHHHLYPSEFRHCTPPENEVNHYIQRMDFYKCCPEFNDLAKENFSRNDPAGRFVPVMEARSLHDADTISQGMVEMMFPGGEADSDYVKYVLSELMDNVLQHSASPIGCIAQAQLYGREFYGVMADCGMGIKQHLKRNPKWVSATATDMEAIELAVQPFVSGNPNAGRPIRQAEIDGYTNRGLGLAVSSEIMKRSSGHIEVVSGTASYRICENGVLRRNIKGWPGTMIFLKADCQKLAKPADIVQEFEMLQKKG